MTRKTKFMIIMILFSSPSLVKTFAQRPSETVKIKTIELIETIRDKPIWTIPLIRKINTNYVSVMYLANGKIDDASSIQQEFDGEYRRNGSKREFIWKQPIIWKGELVEGASAYHRTIFDGRYLIKNKYYLSDDGIRLEGEAWRGSLVIMDKTDPGEYFSNLPMGGQLDGIFGDAASPYWKIMLLPTSELQEVIKVDEIDGFRCYMFEGMTERGEYRVWVDPEYGHRIRKAEIIRVSDFISNKQDKISLSYAKKNGRERIIRIRYGIAEVEIKQHNEGYFPIKLTQSIEKEWDNGEKLMQTYKIEVTEYQIQPNFDDLAAFRPIVPDVPVRLESAPGLKFKWADGKIIPATGEWSLIAELDVDAKIIREGRGEDKNRLSESNTRLPVDSSVEIKEEGIEETIRAKMILWVFIPFSTFIITFVGITIMRKRKVRKGS